jgi:hypothetical protein
MLDFIIKYRDNLPLSLLSLLGEDNIKMDLRERMGWDGLDLSRSG